jgi:hypothetical protein
MNERLSLTLLKAGILLVDDVQLAFPPHDLTIFTAFFDGCTYFHCSLLLALAYSY